MKEKFYITTAIPYTSKRPHVGNTYETVLTDAIARYKKMKGYDVYFLTGTDEHGQKIEEIANENGISPKEYVDSITGEIKKTLKMLNVKYDRFIRTTDEDHVAAVKKIFNKLYENGDIYKGHYEGLYCVPCESFFTELQLNNGKCPDCGREVKKTKDEAYFLKLTKYQEKLSKYIEEHPDFITPKSREKEMVNNFIKPGLQDLCITRTNINWGIDIDIDPKHVIYVWLDALTNYITALGYTPDGNSELFNKYWPCDLHVIGKDILRFHSIYWPIMLMALDLPLPKQIYAHGWYNFGNDKMSKSKGNVIYASDLVDFFGVDAVRFYLLSEMPYVQDGSITYDSIISKINSDLANTIGNLVNRTVTMVNKYFNGTLSKPLALNDEFDLDLIKTANNAYYKYSKLMDKYKMSDAIEEIMVLARRSNKYIDETMPWVLAKSDETKSRLNDVLYNLVESIRFIAVMLSPIMPDTAENIFTQIGTNLNSFDDISEFGKLENNHKVGANIVLFARLDEEKTLADISEKLGSANVPIQEKESAVNSDDIKPISEQIDIDTFFKSDIRVAKVLECEKVPKSSKLLKLKVSIGSETRQVVSGIAKVHTPEELIGKKVLMVANLKPAKLCGIESQGMILSSEHPDGSFKVIFANDNVPEGSVIC